MKPFPRSRPVNAQSGYALILMVLALMGVGGVVLTGYTQGVKVESEQERYLHNQRVLREAKQALLQYAYNYPVTAGNGPGRLPCPDTDNDVDGNPNATALCGSPNGNVGRFPWGEDELDFYDARDASGERLWYAVSSAFANNGLGVSINSDTQGTITVQDRSLAFLHDATANSGAVAVIIAPGPPIERAGVMQVRSGAFNDPTRVNPANYLDLFGAIDNSDFVHNNANGFVTGPILDVVTGDLLVNDQMIVITAAEVAAMAEKATLQAYREAINEYLVATGNVYPWLYNYQRDPVNGLNFGELSSLYPADEDFPTEEGAYLSNSGRIPSMFRPYFSEATSGPIESKLSVVISNADLAGDIIYNRTVPSGSTGTYTFVNTIWNGSPAAAGYASINLNEESDEPITNLRFEDDAPGDDVVRLVGTIGADETHSLGFTIWFWSLIGGTEWAQCAGAQIESCHVNSAFLPIPGLPGEEAIQILKVEVELFFDSADDVEFELDLSNLPDPRAPLIVAADGTNHAWIGETFAAADVVSNAVIQIRYEWDDNYTDANWDVDESGTLDFASIGGANLQLGLRYYPELPNWMLANGWHDTIRMAYAPNFKPDIAGACTVLANDCLEITDASGGVRDKIALLVIAGENDWFDDDASGLDNDEGDVFDASNFDGDESFLLHEGNDEILVIEEL